MRHNCAFTQSNLFSYCYRCLEQDRLREARLHYNTARVHVTFYVSYSTNWSLVLDLLSGSLLLVARRLRLVVSNGWRRGRFVVASWLVARLPGGEVTGYPAIIWLYIKHWLLFYFWVTDDFLIFRGLQPVPNEEVFRIYEGTHLAITKINPSNFLNVGLSWSVWSFFTNWFYF